MALTAEVLAEWREAERTLSILSDDAPERPAVAAAAEEMRQLYHYVSVDLTVATENVIARTRTRIEETRALLRAVRDSR
jgi:hypothetical protein